MNSHSPRTDQPASLPLEYFVADVFTRQPLAGNPVAIFTGAADLSASDMQRIARELNISETVFILAPSTDAADLGIRIFTPQMELPFAGHPTLGTALTLLELGRLGGNVNRINIEEKAGLVPVRFFRRDGATFAALTSPRTPVELEVDAPPAQLAAMLGLQVGDLGPLSPAAYTAGVPYMLVPVKDEKALARVTLDFGCWRSLLAGNAAPHIYVFTMEDWVTGNVVRARMFAPAMGIVEDPATGAAAAALAGALTKIQTSRDGTHEWIIEQGHYIARPSEIILIGEVASGELASVGVAGASTLVARGVFHGLGRT